ncbi:hypothetical protein [Euzebya tangerina]|uniref:hypothetical protein n=1 Tax=Euzebya tangerina TaxID=591198 RepID=UPI000E30DC33|nr:hypothetical protein [Euzebya tangerina]
MSTPNRTSIPGADAPRARYEAGLLVAPAEELVTRTLNDDNSDVVAASLLMALLGWDDALTALARSSHSRAGVVMGALAAWVLFD